MRVTKLGHQFRSVENCLKILLSSVNVTKSTQNDCFGNFEHSFAL